MNHSRNLLLALLVISSAVAMIWFVAPVLAAQSPNTISTIIGGGSVQGMLATAADVPGPTSVVKDAAGDLFVAAPYSRDVFKVTGRKIGVFAGQGWGGYGGDNGSPSKAVLGLPYGVAMDTKGELFISDTGNSRIRMVVNGVITTVAGSGEKCAESTNVCGDGGPATDPNAKLNLPVAVAVDAAGNLYIADSNDNRIRFVNRTSSPITISGKTIQPGNIDTIAGTGQTCPTGSTCGNGGPAANATLNLPSGIAVDANGNIFIADSKDQMVREIPVGPNSNIILLAGQPWSACPDPTAVCGDNGPAARAFLRLPSGVAVDHSGNVYIADTNDNRLRVVNMQSGSITVDQISINVGNIATVAGNGSQGFAGDGGGSTAAFLDIPQGIYVDSAGNQYISDTGNQRVRFVLNSTGVINTVVGGGSGDANGTKAILAAPNDIIKDASGDLIIADEVHDRIRKVDTSMNVTTVVGNGSAGFSGDGGNALNAQMNAPTSIALDPSGNLLYIADSNNLVVRAVSNWNSNGPISTVAGNGLNCSPVTAACGDGGPATQGSFAFPLWVTTDATGNLIIADYFANRVRAVNTHSTDVTIFNVTIGAGDIATIAGTGAQCPIGNYGTKCGDGGPATSALLYHPSAVAIDSSGNLYICDQYIMRIRRVDATSGIITLYALDGVAHLSGNGGPALDGSMWNPLSIATDPFNNLFISGGNDSTVQMVDAATEYFGTVAGNPTHADQGGYSGDGGPATQAKLANVGVAVDASENLYISDFGNNRIRYVALAPALGPISNSPLQFGPWAIGTTSTPLFVNITGGSGGVDTSLTWTVSGTNLGDFNANAGTCPNEISPYRQCTVGVTFTPTADGPRKATLTLTYNAPGSPTVINLSGSGPDFTITGNPTTVTINPGDKGSSTLTITPIAGFAQTINFICTGSTLGLQVVCPAPINPNGVQVQTTVNFNTLASIKPGSYPVTVSAQSPPLIHPVSITVTVP
jgi:trimeric autotransporter adhesin